MLPRKLGNQTSTKDEKNTLFSSFTKFFMKNFDNQTHPKFTLEKRNSYSCGWNYVLIKLMLIIYDLNTIHISIYLFTSLHG